MAQRFKAQVRRRIPEDDRDCTPEDTWPPELRWVADWDRVDADTGRYISGGTSPHETWEAALAEAVHEADEVRRQNAREETRDA